MQLEKNGINQLFRLGEEPRKIEPKKRARLLILNLNSQSNNTQLLNNGVASSKRFILFKLFLPKSKNINLAFLLTIYFFFQITFIGF